jgi:peptidoglycan/LPS O-acetylase OafA/YrhL
MFMQGRLPRSYREVIGFSTDPILIAILIVQLLALMPAASVAWLEWPWLRYLGRISYPLYLYQQIVIGAIERRTHSLPAVFTFAIVSAACVAAASCSYFLVEKPALRWKHRFERVRSPA